MDKHNNPSGNINNSNDNPWEYQANEVENTQEIPVVNDESPRGNGDNNMHSAPEHTPSTYAPETKQESHLGRNLSIVGAVAVAAVAGAVAMFSGNQTNAAGPITSSGTEISAPSHETNEPTTSTNPDTEKIQAYKDTQAYADGLTIQEFANSCGFDNLSDVYNYCGEDISSRLQYEMSKMGYHINGYEMVTDPQGKLFSSISGSFVPENSATKLIGVGVEAYIEDNTYHIQMHSVPNNGVYIDYNTDTIPTPEEAAQILADNS